MTARTTARRCLLLVLAVVLLSGCGLPLPEGVRSAGDVPAEQPEQVGIQVLPPGPQEGATAVDLVQGFLRAQSSPSDAHAVAREFLAPGTTWDDDEFVIVYRASSATVVPDPERLGSVLVTLETVARISDDGSYRLENRPLVERYTVARQPDGQLRLTGVPVGLRLTPADRELSYRPYEVDFLRVATTGEPTSRLVPDRVFLPVTADQAQAAVAAALRGPSAPLQGAVVAAAPPGTRLLSRVRVDAGVVTADLSSEARTLDLRGRQRLSAQLVWTLHPAYTGLRLLVEGRPFPVDGAGDVQDVSDWPGYDPSGADERAPLLYVKDRTLFGLDGAPEVSEATLAGGLPVDEAAASPLRGSLGLRTTTLNGVDEVRIGPAGGPFGRPLLAEPGLGSLSWGPGDQGLWVLQQGRRPVVWLLPGPDAAPGAPPRTVEYESPPGAPGPLTHLRVSRDGTRVAMVFGEGKQRRLHAGRIEPQAGQLAITGIMAIAPGLSDVTDVAWKDGTFLAVLAADTETAGLLPVEVAVDGSSVAPVQRGGLTGTPVAIAAAPRRPLTVATLEDGRSRLFRDNGALFRLQQDGSRPFYPG